MDSPVRGCVRRLFGRIERGARGYDSNSPVISRIIRQQFNTDAAQVARVPHLINEAVVGMAIARKRPRDGA
jgi:hypothetical protein